MIHCLTYNGTYCGLMPIKPFIDYDTKIPLDEIIYDVKHTNAIDKNGMIFIHQFDYGLTQLERCTALNRVNCPDCLDIIKSKSYYCNIHGSLIGREVTFDEKCIYCGLDV